MSKVWFTSDTHFGHTRTLELSRRPYKNIDEMNWDMVKKWNSVVSDGDTVYHLGDFGDYEFSKYLKGKIILLFGNYDFQYFKDHKDERLLDLTSHYGFDSYWLSKSATLLIDGNEYQMVHEPSHADNSRFYLFGHIHKAQMVKKNGFNVGVDCHNYYPVSLETVEFYQNAIQNHYDGEVFEV